MMQIKQITSDPLQIQTLVLPDGSSIFITLAYVESQLGWFFRTITWNDFILNNLRITNQPNMLFQWKNKLPFGMACFSTQDREPTQLQDFQSGASNLYVLTESEVDQYAELLSG